MKPAVLQSEFHPNYLQKDVRKLCHTHGIHFQSYSTLGQSRLLSGDQFQSLGHRHQKTIAQVLLRWAIQKNISVIPKSSNKKHIFENFNVFDFKLSEKVVEEIDSTCSNIKYAWDPIIIE